MTRVHLVLIILLIVYVTEEQQLVQGINKLKSDFI